MLSRCIAAAFSFILLLDFVAFYCFHADSWPNLPHPMNVVSGLAVGQLLLVATWLALRRKHDLWSVIVPLIGLWIASLLRSKVGFFPGFTFFDYLVRNLLQALVVLLVLLPISRTPLWQWITRDTVVRRLDFSIADILIWTSGAAILGMLVRQNTLAVVLTQWMGLLAPGLLALSIVLIHQLPIPWYIRFVPQVALGAFAGILLARLGNNPRLSPVLKTEFATQAAVMAFGLAVAFPLPRIASELEPRDTNAAEQ